MTDDITRIEAHTLIGAYALDAVSDTERLLVEQHLADCRSCAEEAAELRETTALLASYATVEPPAGLRERVLAAVAGTRQLPPEVEHVQPNRRQSDAEGAHTAPPGSPGTSPWRVVWLRRGAAVAAAAGIAAVVVLGVQVVDDQRRTERDLQALHQVDERNSRAMELLSAPDAKLVRGEVNGGGTGTVVASPFRGQVLLLAEGLPQLPQDRTYQVWLIGADGPRSAGLLTSSGGRFLPLLAGGFTGREAVGVTVEPQGGSARPTTPAVVVVPLV
ncbi:anti-sigma factor [Actinosynnema sp. CA-248983]